MSIGLGWALVERCTALARKERAPTELLNCTLDLEGAASLFMCTMLWSPLLFLLPFASPSPIYILPSMLSRVFGCLLPDVHLLCVTEPHA